MSHAKCGRKLDYGPVYSSLPKMPILTAAKMMVEGIFNYAFAWRTLGPLHRTIISLSMPSNDTGRRGSATEPYVEQNDSMIDNTGPKLATKNLKRSSGVRKIERVSPSPTVRVGTSGVHSNTFLASSDFPPSTKHSSAQWANNEVFFSLMLTSVSSKQFDIASPRSRRNEITSFLANLTSWRWSSELTAELAPLVAWLLSLAKMGTSLYVPFRSQVVEMASKLCQPAVDFKDFKSWRTLSRFP